MPATATPPLSFSPVCSRASASHCWPPMARRELFLALLCLAACALATGPADATRKMVGVYELRKGDFSVRLTNWGARVMSVVLPDCKGNLADVVLGRDTIAEYVNDTEYFGPITGRTAQRVARGRFVLDGKVYHMHKNDGRNTIHGGDRGFSRSIWTVKEYVGGGESPYITFYYRSFDGEQGLPGNVDAYVTYRMSGPYTLGVHMNATALDKATPVNFLLHVYWNLGGEGSGRDVLGHTLRLHASRYAVLDDELLPSPGRIESVAGTPLDFRTPTPIGSRIRQVVVMGGRAVGYDANYIVDGGEGTMRPVAQARDPASGRALELWANQPTMHAALHGELPQPHQGQARQGVRQVRGVLPGDHGVRGRRQPPRVPVADAQARPGVQARYGLQVLVLGDDDYDDVWCTVHKHDVNTSSPLVCAGQSIIFG